MTLRRRLALVTAGAVAGSILLVAFVVYHAERRELRLLADADLRREAAAVAESLPAPAAPGRRSSIAAGAERRAALGVEVYAQVVHPDGRVARLGEGGALVPVTNAALAVAAGTRDRFYADARVDGRVVRTLTVPLADGALIVARTVADIDAHLVDIGIALSLVAVAGIGVAVLVGGVVAGTALRPVTRFTEATEHLTRERTLRPRLVVGADDELGRLALSVNALLDTLDDAQHSQRQLVADASHELRTPLTSLLTNVEVLADNRLPTTERERLLDELHDELSSLVAAVDDLLELAHDESSRTQLDDVALEEVVRDCVEAARRRWPETTFRCELAAAGASADRAQVERLVSNLLDNAAKWTPAGAAVDIVLDHDALVVRDRGPGIPEDEVEIIFERFHRAPAARGLPGAGLGLAIVRKVADVHGWRVAAANDPDGGARFRLELRPGPTPLLTDERPSRVSSTSSGRGRVGPASATWAAGWLLVGVLVAAPLVLVFERGVGGADLPELRTVTGTLAACGSQLCVGEAVVDFGPGWYVETSRAVHDFDGDGRVGSLAAELDGLRDRTITLETDGGALDQDVYTIEGLPFRDGDGELPPPRPTDTGRPPTSRTRPADLPPWRDGGPLPRLPRRATSSPDPSPAT